MTTNSLLLKQFEPYAALRIDQVLTATFGALSKDIDRAYSAMANNNGLLKVKMLSSEREHNLLERALLWDVPEKITGLKPDIIESHPAFQNYRAHLAEEGIVVQVKGIDTPDHDVGLGKISRFATGVSTLAAISFAPLNSDASMLSLGVGIVWAALGHNSMKNDNNSYIKMSLSRNNGLDLK